MFYRSLILFMLCCTITQVTATTFILPQDSNIVGKIQISTVQPGESLADVGRRFDLGMYEMMEANPNLDPWIPKVGARVVVPTKFIVPEIRPDEIVINLAEMRIYYLHKDKKTLTTHPIGIGRKGWGTPLGRTKIIQKTENPTWTPPDSIRELHLTKGEVLPDVVPPGPDNPLGKFAMRLSIPGYLLHGTNRPAGIGVRSTSGCIRMFPEDVKKFFYKVSIGTRVNIIHKPYKIGYSGNNIFLEAHQPLSEPRYRKHFDTKDMLRSLPISVVNHMLDWQRISKAIEQARGYPVLVH